MLQSLVKTNCIYRRVALTAIKFAVFGLVLTHNKSALSAEIALVRTLRAVH